MAFAAARMIMPKDKGAIQQVRNGACLTFQMDVDQTCPGWKEKLGYTNESSVDWQKKVASAAGATETSDGKQV